MSSRLGDEEKAATARATPTSPVMPWVSMNSRMWS